MKRERDSTKEEFEKLLAWLDSERDEAGSRLNLINARLIRIFVSRGCIDAERLADEVINRVAVRIDQVTKTYAEPLFCCLGFADNVYREYLREQRRTVTLMEPPAPRSSDELEREDVCMGRCLDELTKAERELCVHYFRGEKRARIDRRKQLAAQWELTANALRIQAHRIRRKARQCLETCLAET